MTETDGEFLLVYVVVAAIVVLSAKAVQLGFMNLFDGDAEADTPDAGGAGAGLRVGSLPTGSELLSVGYLRAGHAGIADALLARAAAEGWLIEVGERGALEAFDLPKGASRESATLKEQLRTTTPRPSGLERAATVVAREVAAPLDAELIRQGHLFGPGLRVTGAIVYGVLVLSVVAVGVARAFADASASIAPLIAAAVVAAAAARFAKADARTRRARRYLDWLRDTTDALRLDVLEGRSTEPADLELVGAVFGAQALPIFAKSSAEERRAQEA